MSEMTHDEVMKWTHFSQYWPFVREIHLSPVDSLYKGPMMQSFDISIDNSLCKLLNKQSRGRWIKTPWSFDIAVMEKR